MSRSSFSRSALAEPTPTMKRLNPSIFGPVPAQKCPQDASEAPKPCRHTPRVEKPLLNGLETRYRNWLRSWGRDAILQQAITLRLDPPYKSYRPDLAYFDMGSIEWVFIEVKGPHRFREKGIAKAALAAKTYPMFRFLLADWVDGQWKETWL